MDSRQWYVVQSKPHKESLICSQLLRTRGEIDFFFPKIKNHHGIRPLFPSYLFVHAGINRMDHLHLVKYTRGVLRIVGNGDEGPIAIADEVVETIRNRIGSDGLIDQSRQYTFGDAVRVCRGPLKDLVGILEKPTAESGRVQVLFKLLKYPLRALLAYSDLEAVSASI